MSVPSRQFHAYLSYCALNRVAHVVTVFNEDLLDFTRFHQVLETLRQTITNSTHPSLNLGSKSQKANLAYSSQLFNVASLLVLLTKLTLHYYVLRSRKGSKT